MDEDGLILPSLLLGPPKPSTNKYGKHRQSPVPILTASAYIRRTVPRVRRRRTKRDSGSFDRIITVYLVFTTTVIRL